MKLKSSPENCETRSGSACLAWWRHLAIVLLLLAFVACSSDDETAGGSSEETQGIAITDKQVAGVSQKGPFVKGSSVTVQELRNGTTLAQTGRSFKGKIASDKGDFSVMVDSLVSQYALLEVNGYYYNEITGDKSGSVIALNALTDLSDRDNVNINLLTHLEYDRVVNLVLDGMTVKEAKLQAEKEILGVFYVDGEYDEFENMDIFKKGDGNAALLAISVLLQGDRREGSLVELLFNVDMAIASRGSWEDKQTRIDIADWAESQDLNKGLEKIRANVEGWNNGDVPGFENYVRNFWYQEYGLGDCAKEMQGEEKKNENKLSANFGSVYICYDERWHRASLRDMQYGICGESRKGLVVEQEFGGTCECDGEDWVCHNYVGKSGFLWNGSDLNSRIQAVEDTALNAGYFQYATDVKDGGKSYFMWPADMQEGPDSLSAVVASCGGICGDIHFNAGTFKYMPYVLVYFYIAGLNEEGDLISADVSGWKGICLEYSSDGEFRLELGTPHDALVAGNRPGVHLPAGEGVLAHIPWDAFSQDPWGETYMVLSAADAAKELQTVNFKFSQSENQYFRITQIGSYGACE